jgi:hypothetical protein
MAGAATASTRMEQGSRPAAAAALFEPDCMSLGYLGPAGFGGDGIGGSFDGGFFGAGFVALAPLGPGATDT